jgi:ankyrin repeat protein
MELLDRGADIDAVNPGLQSALLIAMLHGQDRCAQVLIERGAEVNLNDLFDYSPLMAAAANCNLDTIQALISNGADINAISFNGITVIKCAEQRNRPDVIALLKSHSKG